MLGMRLSTSDAETSVLLRSMAMGRMGSGSTGRKTEVDAADNKADVDVAKDKTEVDATEDKTKVGAADDKPEVDTAAPATWETAPTRTARAVNICIVYVWMAILKGDNCGELLAEGQGHGSRRDQFTSTCRDKAEERVNDVMYKKQREQPRSSTSYIPFANVSGHRDPSTQPRAYSRLLKY